MPRYKTVSTLYRICVKEVTKIILKFCVNLEKSDIQSKSSILNFINCYLCASIPSSILDDILEYFSKNESNEAIMCYYFYKTLLHDRVKKFRAKNVQLKLSYWECMFKSFSNLIELNLALSCSDDILHLIAKYCPNLEYLNATCRYERMRMGSNATTFTMTVTDSGLKHLWGCRKLKVITLNEPRSKRHGIPKSITYVGLRNLLLNLPTIEDITYTDLGSVISQGMEHIDTLNLRIMRHFNTTETTIREILRLCRHLEELHLTFFNIEEHTGIINALLNSNQNIKSLGLVNFNFGESFDDFFARMGNNLVYLSVTNCIKTISFANMITIGRCCPNLKFLKYSLIDNSRDSILDRSLINRNMEYFAKIEDLYISGNELDLENVLMLCTQNAKYLENFKLTENYSNKNVDDIFMKHLNTYNLKHLEISTKLVFTETGIRKLIEKYPKLNYLSVYCTDNCDQIKNEILSENYDLTFINQKNIFRFD